MINLNVLILKVLQWIIYLVDQVLIVGIGYSLHFGWTKDQLKARANYESSAQILKIGFRAKSWDVLPASLDQFLLFHCDYVHPRTVCQDHITLLTVTPELAFFVVLPAKDVDIYSSDLNAFMYVAQFKYATHLVVMPISSFYRLADELGDPKAQVVLLSNTGRCGSTLLAQMFEAVPKTLVMSEPDAFTQTGADFSAGKITGNEEEELLRSIFRVQCKHSNEKEITRIIIKTRSASARQIYKVYSSCKFVRHLYMYRHPKENILSFMSVMTQVKKAVNVKKFFPIPDNSGFSYQSIKFDRLLQSLQWPGALALSWVLNIACYIEYKHRGVEIYPIVYESLIKDTEKTTSKLFSFLGIPQKLTTQAMDALKKDSQRESFLAKKVVAKKRSHGFTADQLKEVNFVLQNAGFSSVEDFEDLPDKSQLKLDSLLGAEFLG